MKFYELYKNTVSYFPTEIDISDGSLVDDVEGFVSQRLWAAYEIADKTAKNNCEVLLAWNIYKILHKRARTHFSNAASFKILRLDTEINMSQLEEAFLADLQTEEWEEVLKEYLEDVR